MDLSYEYKIAKEKEAYKRLYTEVLIRAFNDILPRRFYQYHMVQVLKHNKKRSKFLIDKHHEAIKWLMNFKNELCFEVLGLTHLSMDTILMAISKKFNSHLKFQKFYTSYAGETKVEYDTKINGKTTRRYCKTACRESTICEMQKERQAA